MLMFRFVSAFDAVLPQAMNEYIAEVEVQKPGPTEASPKERGDFDPSPHFQPRKEKFGILPP